MVRKAGFQSVNGSSILPEATKHMKHTIELIGNIQFIRECSLYTQDHRIGSLRRAKLKVDGIEIIATVEYSYNRRARNGLGSYILSG
jgi:hypothetical protein